MVRWEKISEKIRQTQTIIGLAILVGILGYTLSFGSLLIGVLASAITIIAFIIWDLDDRLKELEKKRNNRKAKKRGR